MNVTAAAEQLPSRLRYIKNGGGGKWWPRAKAAGELHAGWDDYPDEMILSRDIAGLEAFHGSSPRQDFNALVALLEGPQFVWVTIEDGYLWWCTVSDQIGLDPAGSNQEHGHFWLVADRPWSNRSLRGDLLSVSELPGGVTQVAGFRGTVCEPSGWAATLRVILGTDDPDVIAAAAARQAFTKATEALVKRLHPRDFELLIDLLLQRSGWARVARLGGATEGIDVEVENAATGEVAFVQVKSRAGQGVLDDYATRFQGRRDRYARMVFAVHTSEGLVHPSDPLIRVWEGPQVADLVVKLGLSGWLERRI